MRARCQMGTLSMFDLSTLGTSSYQLDPLKTRVAQLLTHSKLTGRLLEETIFYVLLNLWAQFPCYVYFCRIKYQVLSN